MVRFTIRKGRQGELWGGAWQVWENATHPDSDPQNLKCLRGIWKTYEGCWEMLDERCNICKRPRWAGCSESFHREWLDAIYA